LLAIALSTYVVAYIIHIGIIIDFFHKLDSQQVGNAKFQEYFIRVYGKFVTIVIYGKDPKPHILFES
jgi:hypothetical protein